MTSKQRSITLMACCAAMLAAVGVSSASAQEAAKSASVTAPVYMAAMEKPSVEPMTYSSSAGAAEMEAAEGYISPASPNSPNQPPPRRYGRPTYRSGNSNADGSSKYAFEAAGGFTLPVGDQSNYLTPSWGLEVGGGRNFNKLLGLMLEFNYDEFGLTGQTISQQSYFYTGSSSNVYGIDANSHVWSFSLQPVVNFYSGEGLGAYVTGGVGFYHKVTNFTVPQEESYCDPYYGCGSFEANETFDHYTANSPGYDVGFGLTEKMSRFSGARLFAEARYVFVDSQNKSGVTVANQATYGGYNYFPQNSQHTSYIPIKFGIRF